MFQQAKNAGADVMVTTERCSSNSLNLQTCNTTLFRKDGNQIVEGFWDFEAVEDLCRLGKTDY